MLRAVSDGVIRRQVQAVVIGLVVLVFTAAAALAPGPLADVSAPLERAFAAQHGAEVTATAKASPAQLAATTGLAEVTAAAGPFPETTVTATMLVSPRPGQSGSSLPTQQMTVVGRAWPGGPVDDLTLHSGRWATQPGQAVVLTDGQASDDQASPVGIGTQIAVTGVPGSPRLTVVGTATSITHTAQVWVAPAEIAALRAPGTPDLAQMLYRFASAGTTTQVNADVAALRAALPHGALIGAQSWLTVNLPATDAIAPWSWWQQAVFDSCTLIALAALSLVLIKDLLPSPRRRTQAQRARWQHPYDQELGPVPSRPVTARARRPAPTPGGRPAPSGPLGSPRKIVGPAVRSDTLWRASRGRRDRPAGRTACGNREARIHAVDSRRRDRSSDDHCWTMRSPATSCSGEVSSPGYGIGRTDEPPRR